MLNREIGFGFGFLPFEVSGGFRQVKISSETVSSVFRRLSRTILTHWSHGMVQNYASDAQ